MTHSQAQQVRTAPSIRRNISPFAPNRRRLQQIAILLAAVSLFASTGLCQSKKLDAEELFPRGTLLDIDIKMPTEDWSALTATSRNFMTAMQDPTAKPYSYYKGTITINGVKIDSVGIRKKGFLGSGDDYRPSLKIKFDEFIDQKPVKGLDRLTLNNNKQDFSQVSQHLTYTVFRQAGIQAPRTCFARVTVNGEYLGIYTHVESIRKPFLKNAFGDGSGALYEGTLSDLHPKAINRIEAKNKKAENIEKPGALAELLAADGDLDLAGVERLLDVPHFLKYWAVESLIGFWDGYANNQNNYFMYEHPENQKLYFIPWGADGAFDSTTGMMRGMPLISVGDTAVYANGIIANRLFWAGNIREEYLKVMQDLLDRVWKEDELIAEIDRVEKLFSSDLHEIQSGYRESLDQVRTFIRGRRDQVNGILASGWDSVPKTPREPTHTVPVGTAEGTFATVWSNQPGQSPGGDGVLNLQLVLDGETVKLSGTTSDAGPMAFRDFGRGGGGRGPRGQNAEPPQWVNIRLAGLRQSDNEPITLALMIDRTQFENAAGSEIEVNGTIQEGRGGFGFGRRGGGMRSITGRLTLTEAGLNAGDKISGTFQLDIVVTRGGMFGGR